MATVPSFLPLSPLQAIVPIRRDIDDAGGRMRWMSPIHQISPFVVGPCLPSKHSTDPRTVVDIRSHVLIVGRE
jgi:hypothetical protein